MWRVNKFNWRLLVDNEALIDHHTQKIVSGFKLQWNRFRMELEKRKLWWKDFFIPDIRSIFSCFWLNCCHFHRQQFNPTSVFRRIDLDINIFLAFLSSSMQFLRCEIGSCDMWKMIQNSLNLQSLWCENDTWKRANWFLINKSSKLLVTKLSSATLWAAIEICFTRKTESCKAILWSMEVFVQFHGWRTVTNKVRKVL